MSFKRTELNGRGARRKDGQILIIQEISRILCFKIFYLPNLLDWNEA